MIPYNCELPGERTPFTGGDFPLFDASSRIKPWLFPTLHTVWSCIRLFGDRTNELERRVKELERDVAVLIEALLARQPAVGEVRPPEYSAF